MTKKLPPLDQVEYWDGDIRQWRPADSWGRRADGVLRGLGDWVVGTFVADDTEQEFAAVGEYEVMLQGWVVRDLGAAIPEPGVALCSCTALLLMAVRRRGTV